ncbi:Yos1-like protein [Neohortaea acidophila]|uniref:Yos1-like protein n=1 Tax=Neohortaea acidophila TaxID=245834 RepID=A0A6A6PQ29_9PEZI|nr:Yos1-like protein [Neohortaea acidophila]KAF2482208.1 Yos1-like protein [Neohortaea acidophila]
MATLIPSFGGLFQVSVLLVNAIAILSEDRFLARIGWGSTQNEPAGFGGSSQDSASVKAKMINLINSVRTLMRVPLIFVNLLIIIWAITFG